MKRILRHPIFIATAIVACALPAAAQRTRTIPAGGGTNLIRTFIENDLKATDTATVESTVYLLNRGATYPYVGQWRPGFDVNIQAAPGLGERPRILAVAGATQADRWLRAFGSQTFKGLNLPSTDSNGEQTDNAPLRPSANDAKVLVEDCVLSDQRFEVLRTQGSRLTVRMLNNIVANNYQTNQWYKTGGLWFQNASPVDTIIFRNNTYYNTPGRMTHSINGSRIKYQYWGYNTVVNVGGQNELNQYEGGLNQAVLDLGVADEAIVENNLLYNVGFMGVFANDKDSIGIFNMYPSDSVSQKLTIRNNNVYTDPALLANTPDTAAQIPMFTAVLDSILRSKGTAGQTAMQVFEANGNISERLNFANAPMNLQKFIDAKKARWESPTTADRTPLILDKLSPELLNFAYPTSARSYTAASDGGPVGSRRWYPNFVPTSIQEPDFNPGILRIGSLYPNPVESEINLSLDLTQAGIVTVDLYDVRGGRILHENLGRREVGHGQAVRLESVGLPGGAYTLLVTVATQSGLVGASTKLIAL